MAASPSFPFEVDPVLLEEACGHDEEPPSREFLETELGSRPWMEPVALQWDMETGLGLRALRLFVRAVQLETFFDWVAALNDGVAAFSTPASWPLSVSYNHALTDSLFCFQIRFVYADPDHLAYFQYVLREALRAIPL